MARPTSPKTIVSRLLSASHRPVYILDSSQRIVFANRALADWVQMPVDALYSLRCRYALDGTGTIENSLAVPPQALEVAEFRSTIAFAGPDGGSRRRALYLAVDDQSARNATLVLVDAEEASVSGEPSVDAELLHSELLRWRGRWSAAYSLDQMIGLSSAMGRVRSQVQLAANSSCRVVIVGKSGTGRETVARTIHHERSGGRHRLVPLSCDLLDVELLHSTVEAFVRQTSELDNAGPCTLLLLEVDKLTPESQSALLGVLEISELELQTIATSQACLADLATRREFRFELAQHLGCLEIRIPTLTERLEDLPLLAQWMLEKSEHAERVGGFTPHAIEALLRYQWPGEVGELREVVTIAAERAQGTLIGTEDLPEKLAHAAAASVLPDLEPDRIELAQILTDVESELIVRALRRTKGNRAEAARSLGISRAKLLRRIEQLGVDAP